MAQEASDRTGINIARTIWRWGGWLVSVAITVGARQLILSSGGPETSGVILEAVGAALLVAGGGMALMWLGHLVWSACPRQRLRARADLIDATMTALESDHPERKNSEYQGTSHQDRIINEVAPSPDDPCARQAGSAASSVRERRESLACFPIEIVGCYLSG